MRVDYAFIAEAADAQGGLFYVTRGGADLHFFPRDAERPLRIGAVSFVVRVLGEPEDVGVPTRLASAIVDADGQTVNFSQEFEVSLEPHPIDPTRTGASVVTFRFYGFPVPDFGTYLFEVRQGEDRLAQVPFWVVPLEPSQPGVPPAL